MDEVLRDFWKQSEYADAEYLEPPPTAEVVKSIEAELGYRLPAAYVALARQRNGGMLLRRNHRTSEPTSWARDHVAVKGIFAIGRDKRRSLCGPQGSRFWMKEWGYPDIGVYFADCPSGAHTMLCLDYRQCGADGEPAVVHVDQQSKYKVTIVAPSFEAFVQGLEGDEAFAG
jgi:hypothetical protein